MFKKYTCLVSHLLSDCREEETRILDSVMGRNVYDARIRPDSVNGSAAATFVYVNVFVRSFSAIDDVKMVSKRRFSDWNGRSEMKSILCHV